MMGMGATSPLIWLLGVLAMVIIWGGVWWGLSALVFHWPARERTQSPTDAHQVDGTDSQPWQQPTFQSNPDRSQAGVASPQASSQAPPGCHQHTHKERDYR